MIFRALVPYVLHSNITYKRTTSHIRASLSTTARRRRELYNVIAFNYKKKNNLTNPFLF